MRGHWDRVDVVVAGRPHSPDGTLDQLLHIICIRFFVRRIGKCLGIAAGAAGHATITTIMVIIVIVVIIILDHISFVHLTEPLHAQLRVDIDLMRCCHRRRMRTQ